MRELRMLCVLFESAYSSSIRRIRVCLPERLDGSVCVYNSNHTI